METFPEALKTSVNCVCCLGQSPGYRRSAVASLPGSFSWSYLAKPCSLYSFRLEGCGTGLFFSLCQSLLLHRCIICRKCVWTLLNMNTRSTRSYLLAFSRSDRHTDMRCSKTDSLYFFQKKTTLFQQHACTHLKTHTHTYAKHSSCLTVGIAPRTWVEWFGHLHVTVTHHDVAMCVWEWVNLGSGLSKTERRGNTVTNSEKD